MTPTSLASLAASPVIQVDPDSTVAETMALSKRHGVHHFPVSEGSTILGIVCTCDLREAQLTASIRDVMHEQVVVVDEQDDPTTAAEAMKKHSVGSVLVMAHSDTLRGIVTREDLLDGNTEEVAAIQSCRCRYCGSFEHLRLDDAAFYTCVDCLERRQNPGAFEGGRGGG